MKNDQTRNEKNRNTPAIWLQDICVANRIGISRATVWRWAQSGHLPQPVKLSSGCTRWRLSDIEKFEQEAQQ